MSRESKRHLKVDAPDGENRLDHMEQKVIGLPMDRLEGPLKVSGRARYADEEHPAGLAHGVLVRAAITKGKVGKIDVSRIAALPGVLGVIQDPRLIRYPAQGPDQTGPTAGPDVVEFWGQPIAVVVAESFETARQAAQLLHLSFEAEAAETDPEAVTPEMPKSDQQSQGDLEAAMRAAPVTLDEVWHTPSMTAAALEPHATVAEWTGDHLTLRGSLQVLASNRRQLADALGVKPDRLRLIAPYVGGGFGSKLGIAADAVAAAIAAKALGRPVSVVMQRPQIAEQSHRRSESRQRIRLAADAEGRLSAISHEALVSNLPGIDYAEPVTQATPFTYAAPNREIIQKQARIHRSSSGSVRAPGEAIGVTVFECAMDEMAEKLGMDPVEFRLRNIPEVDPTTGKPFSSNMLAACLRDGAERFGWTARGAGGGREGRSEGEWLFGTGMASAVRVNMLLPSQARVRLTGQGARVETDMTDIGTGTYTILRQICAEMLGLKPEQVEVVLGDTDLPPAAGSGGSFGAASSGTSVYLACEELRHELARRLGCAEAELKLKDGRILGPGGERPLADLLGGDEIAALGHVEPGKAEKMARQATWGAHFVEVAVSRYTGEVRLRRQLGSFALGRVLNAKTARSQCLGGMTFGIGIALTEELAHDPRSGQIMTRDLAGYHIPCHADVPAQEVHFVEERDPYIGPMQAKGAGEVAICGAAAAILNAIYDACGVRVRDLPATPDKIIKGLIASGR